MFLPPEPSRIAARIAAANERRARRVRGLLVPRLERHRLALRALDAAARQARGPAKRAMWLDPIMRAWLSDAEEAAALARPPRDDEALFEKVAAGPHLLEVVPRGRIDRGFRERARAVGIRLTDRALDRLPLVLAGRTPPGQRFGPFPVDLSADPDQARSAGEIHLSFPVPVSVILPPPVTLTLADAGVALRGGPGRPRLTPRPTIGGSPIVLARRLVVGPGGPVPGGQPSAGLRRRFGDALSLLALVWPESHRDVIARTAAVVPIDERGVVSYSMPGRPGMSWIRVRGKSLVDLADDLLHEAAHHALHDLEEAGPLARDDGEPRYLSAWRRTIRPLRGILHATYTFTWRAELLRRLLRARHVPAPRAWLRDELAFELEALGRSLGDLGDARRRGHLTPSGSRLVGAIAARVSSIGRGRG